MRCPNCEAGEMSKWHEEHICSNCGYRQGEAPRPQLLAVLIADSLSTLPEEKQ